MPPEIKKRSDIHHFSSGSNISVVMGTYSSMRLRYLPSTVNKKSPGLKRMVSIEFVAHDESVYQEQIDENYEESPLNEKYKEYPNGMYAYYKYCRCFKDNNKFN